MPRTFHLFTKPTLDLHRSIDVRMWARDGWLSQPNRFHCCWTRQGEEVARINIYPSPGFVRLVYRYRLNGGPWQDIDDTVHLTETPCNYGGSRTWFVCLGCGRRAAKLWGVTAHFRCRLCCGLPYGCQMESEVDKALRRKERLEARLEHVCDNLYLKPKGMHRKTYERIQAGIEAQEQVINGLFIRRFGPSAAVPF